LAQYTFRLRGWHAVAGIVAVLAITLIQMNLRVRSIDDGLEDAVRQTLVNDYSGRGPKDIARMLAQSREGRPVDPLPEAVPRDIRFVSISAHGRARASEFVVRAEVTVDGGPPPDGRPVRYFRASRRVLEPGWRIVGESSAYHYYSALLP